MLYLHVGMHKTGTTFMQRVVFPRFCGITYIRRENLDQFLLLDPARRYLASNERLAGRLWATPAQVEATIARLGQMFPGARILMSFRPHADFIASSYRQYLHQGGTLTFQEYFDPEADTGFMKRDQFLYRFRLEALIKHFGAPPFVFFLREIHHDLGRLLGEMGRYLGAEPPAADQVRDRVRNRGVGYYPALLLRRLNRWNRSEFNPTGRFRLENRLTTTLKIDPRRLCQHWLAFLPDRDFLTAPAREQIRRHYGDDWAFVEAWAGRRTDLAGPDR